MSISLSAQKSLLSLHEKELSIMIDILQKSEEGTNTLALLFDESVRGDHSANVVKLLLQCKKINPSIPDNTAIRQMAKKGHAELVDLLLKDVRVDPNSQNSYGYDALMNASVAGHIEVVKLLLQDPRVNPKASKNWAIRFASDKGHTEIVKLLIPKVNLSEITDKKILDLAEELTPKEIIKVASDKDVSVSRELVSMLSVTRATDYHKWIEIGNILHNIDHRLLDTWIEFSKKAPTKFHNEECVKKWSRFGPIVLTICALELFASRDSPNEYERWIASKEKSIDSFPKNLLKEIVAEMKSLGISSIKTTKATTISVSNLAITDKMRILDISKIQILGEKVTVEFR